MMFCLNKLINDYIDVLYPDTTDAPKWANYLDLCLGFDEDGKLYTQVVIFRNPLHMVYLFRSCSARVCLKYEYSLFRGSILVSGSVIEAGIFFTDMDYV